MKHFLLFSVFLITFSICSQEIDSTFKARHSFYLSGGGHREVLDNYIHGWSAAFGYQVYFPNRFVFGIEVLTDQSSYKRATPFNPHESRELRYSGISGRINLGFHIVRRKRFDFTLFVVPHFYHSKVITKTHFQKTDEYRITEKNLTYIFTPILAQRFEFYYKPNPSHGIGLIADLNFETESKIIGKGINAHVLTMIRLMLSYRITIPQSKKL